MAGIYNDDGATLNATDDDIYNNTLAGSGDGGAIGAGIQTRGAVTSLTNVRIYSNSITANQSSSAAGIYVSWAA